MPDNPNERRSHNRRLAETCAKAGLYVFPSSGKVPLALAWERIDTAIGTDGAEDIRAEARAKAAKKGREFDEETFVGATKDVSCVRRMWRKHPDAVPSISLGPSNLLVLDADIDDDRHGPTLIRRWCDDNGIDLSSCPITQSQSGGQHIFFQGEKLRSHVGNLMKSMYVQVKAAGNQVVAPGAWREDGKRYRSLPDRPQLLSAYAMRDIPDVPEPILALQTEREKESPATNDAAIDAAIARVKGTDVPDVDTINLLYDFDALAAKDEEFRQIREAPSEDTSANRFTYLKCLQREFPDLSASACFALLQDANGMGEFVGDVAQKQGEWNYRNFARDFINSKTKWSVTDGAAFGAADDDAYLPSHFVEAKENAAERKKDAVWKVESLADLEAGFEPITWLVEDLIEIGTLGIPYGPPGAGKSAAFVDMGLRIAHGLPWQGRPTRKCAVLYVAQEGQKGSKRRVQAWMKRERLEELELCADAAFFMVRRRIDLFTTDKDYRTLRKEVKLIEKLTGMKVGLIVIDTLRASLIGGDENKQSDTSVILKYMDELAVRTGATVMGLHHTGKDADKGASGSTNIIGSVDWSLEVTPGKIATKKVRDAEDNQVFGFKTIGVEVGKDSAGKPQHAVVVEACDPPRDKKADKRAGKAVDGKFGVADDPDSETDADGRSKPVSVRSRALWAGLIDEIAQIVISDKVRPDAEGFKPVAELAEHCPALAEMMGQNLARKLRAKVFGDEPWVPTTFGRLHFGQPSRGRGKGARLMVDKA